MDSGSELERPPSNVQILFGRVLSSFLFVLSLVVLYFSAKYCIKSQSGFVGLAVAILFASVMSFLQYRLFFTKPKALEKRGQKNLSYFLIVLGVLGLLAALLSGEPLFYLGSAGAMCIHAGIRVFKRDNS